MYHCWLYRYPSTLSQQRPKLTADSVLWLAAALPHNCQQQTSTYSLLQHGLNLQSHAEHEYLSSLV
jgi:hypothetical protein